VKLPDEQATRLLEDLVQLSGESPEQALRAALLERLKVVRAELDAHQKKSTQLTREQSDELFGY
jgi:hypothetical protein